MQQWLIEGVGVGVFKPPSPDFPMAFQNRARLNPICENC